MANASTLEQCCEQLLHQLCLHALLPELELPRALQCLGLLLPEHVGEVGTEKIKLCCPTQSRISLQLSCRGRKPRPLLADHCILTLPLHLGLVAGGLEEVGETAGAAPNLLLPPLSNAPLEARGRG